MTFLLKQRDPALKTLVEILTWKRGYGTESELEFLNKWLIPRLVPYGIQIDDVGNLICRVGTAPVLWSSHTDTVHQKSGRQNVKWDGEVLKLHEGKPGDCLGADDGAGIWLMLEMLRAGVEGLYIFHRGEEVGGVGSKHIATETPELLKDIKFAIAFDRKGTADVITEQAGGKCASEAFARSLAMQLPGLYMADPTGVFTDTANYTDLIPECTNLSVGYEMQHGLRETQDTEHLVKLRDALLCLDLSTLVEEREPGDDGYLGGYGFGIGSSKPKSNVSYLRDDEDLADWEPPSSRMDKSAWGLADLVAEFPEIAADMLEEYGVDRAEFVERIQSAFR